LKNVNVYLDTSVGGILNFLMSEGLVPFSWLS